MLRSIALHVRLRREVGGLALLLIALLYNAILLRPELETAGLAWSDATFHLAASERLLASLAGGEPFLDPWVSEWALGYPVWSSYQPLPHLIAAVVLQLTESSLGHAAGFAALQYVLLVTLPLSIYGGARLLRLSPLAAGLAALLVFAPTGTGDLSRYGIGYGAFVWRGSGLYTQLFALHVLVLGLGAIGRTLDSGKHRAGAAVGLALAVLSHVVFGYVAVISAVVSAVVGKPEQWPRRLARLAAIAAAAFLLLAWFVVPLWWVAAEVNHSRLEPLYKWDSFGAAAILSQLGSGNLLDGGRIPVLTALFGCSVVAAALSWRRDRLARLLLAWTVVWLGLFFGRTTWGHLLVLAAVPTDLHLHRLQAAFELFVVLLTAWGIESILRLMMARTRPGTVVVTSIVVAAVVYLGWERALYLLESGRLGRTSVAAYAAERTDVEAALAAAQAILTERPGRVSAGKRATWGDGFRVGDLPMYAFTTLAHLDSVSFLYHSMSLTSDMIPLRDEDDAAHDVAFGVRVLIAPADRAVPPHMRLRSQAGRFAVYESSTEGYFGLVDIGARYGGPFSTRHEASTTWLHSTWLRHGVVIGLDDTDSLVPVIGRWQPLPALPPELLTPRGEILDESKDGEIYRARIRVQRDCHALVKITWHPGLLATVDGQPTSLRRVTPGFAALPLRSGDHSVEVRYAPGPLRPFLLVAGLVLFVALVGTRGAAVAAWIETRTSMALAGVSRRFDSKRAMTALALLVLLLLSLRPLFRGQLINGHDATAYPARIVEFERALSDGQRPPFWAPDLGAGYGQPLFGFAPPLLYLAAMPFRAVGGTLTHSLQYAVAALCVGGGVAMFLLGRRSTASPVAALGGAAAWLFTPYLALDLYVRAAFAEAAALAMAPIALLGLLSALDRPTLARIAGGGMAVALVPLGHNAVALLLFPALALVIAVRGTWRSWVVGSTVLAIGLGLSAFFWLPALLEQSFVKTDLLREGFLHWRVHALAPGQLLWGAWDHGYSVAGTEDGMSFALGPVHLGLALLGLGVALRAGRRARASEAVALAVIAAVGSWLATSWSAPVWEHSETLRYLTHPWRSLLLPATFLPLLAVMAFDWLRPRTRLLAIAALVALNLPHADPKGFLIFDEEYFLPESIARNGLRTTTYEEYAPRWVTAQPAFTVDRLNGQPPFSQSQIISLRSDHQELVMTATAPTVAEAATFYYPGWRVLVDGQETAVAPTPDRGTISFQLAPGRHHVIIELRPTPLRRYAALLSSALLVALMSLLLLRRLAR